jgi:hypothetical protein
MGILADGVREGSAIGSTLGGLAWSNLIYWGGLFAFFGASMKIPFLFYKGEMYVYNPGQEMHDFLMFMYENQTLSAIVGSLLLGLYAVHLVSQNGGGPSDTEGEPNGPEPTFSDLYAQLASSR